MKLSPVNMRKMVQAVVVVLRGDKPTAPVDAYVLKLIALYMLADEEASQIFDEHLKEYDSRVIQLWKGWISHVRAENYAEQRSSELDAMDFFRRIVNEHDGGKGPRGQY